MKASNKCSQGRLPQPDLQEFKVGKKTFSNAIKHEVRSREECIKPA